MIFQSVKQSIKYAVNVNQEEKKTNCTIRINNERYFMKIIILRHFQRSINPLSLKIRLLKISTIVYAKLVKNQIMYIVKYHY